MDKFSHELAIEDLLKVLDSKQFKVVGYSFDDAYEYTTYKNIKLTFKDTEYTIGIKHQKTSGVSNDNATIL